VKQRAWHAAPYALAIAAAAFFCLTCFTALSRPGLYYDEVNFVNASLGGGDPDQTFIDSRFLDVPSAIMPYIGALKSWLYAPVFALFDVSPGTIRGPAILLALLGIALAGLLARRVFGVWPAALLVVLLATDPVFATMTRVDWGPVAVASVLRVTALIAYLALVRTRSLPYAWVLAAVLLLGLFNKLDFAFFIGGLFAAALVVHRRELIELGRGRVLAACAPAAAFLLALGTLGVPRILDARDLPLSRSANPLSDRLDHRWNLFSDTFDGSAVFGLLTGRPLEAATPAPGVLTAMALALLVVVVVSRVRRRGLPDEPMRTAAFLLVLTATMIACVIATREVTGPHHLIQLWPLPQLLAAALVAIAATAAVPHRGRLVGTGLTVAVLAWLCAAQVGASREYAHAFQGEVGYAPVWTPEIYDVASLARRRGDQVDEIVTADWGIGTQVLALANGGSVRRRFFDTWPTFTADSDASDAQIAADRFRDRSVLVLAHRRESEVMRGSTGRLERAIAALGPRTRVSEVYGGRVLRAYLVRDRPVDRLRAER